MNINFSELLTRIPAVILVLTVHEFAHGLAAYALGDKTAKYDGRLSLNPLKHIDWFGLLALIVFRFGWAKPVMVNPRNFKNPKTDMALTAAAGPIANILFAFILTLIFYPMIIYGNGTGVVGFITSLLVECAIISLSLGFFNLLPIPPLDGSKLFGVFLPDRLYFKFTSLARVGTIVLLILLYMDAVSIVVSPLVNITFNGMLSVATKLFGYGV